jgi:hypothetical protein
MDKWAQALQAAESVIEDNFTHVNKVTIWLVGGHVVGGSKSDSVALNAKLEYDDGGEEKIYYNIPEEMLEELDTEKAMMGYAVEYIINHFILTQYFAKFES